MKKRVLFVVLSLVIMLSMCACGTNEPERIDLNLENWQKYIKLNAQRDFTWEHGYYSHLKMHVSLNGVSQNYEYDIKSIEVKVSVTMKYADGGSEDIEKTGTLSGFDITGASTGVAVIELSGDRKFDGDNGYTNLSIDISSIDGSIQPLNGTAAHSLQSDSPSPNIDYIKLSHGYPGWDE